MRTITITCGRCKKEFPFEHPSVDRAADLMSVTLDCPHCGVELKAPRDTLLMRPMDEYLDQIYDEAGIPGAKEKVRRGVISFPARRPRINNN